jgi:hypothetical protein
VASSFRLSARSNKKQPHYHPEDDEHYDGDRVHAPEVLAKIQTRCARTPAFGSRVKVVVTHTELDTVPEVRGHCGPGKADPFVLTDLIGPI